MRKLLFMLVLCGCAYAQDASKPTLEDQIKALQAQNKLLIEQNNLLRSMIPEPPKHHGKFVVVLQHFLPIVDHAGSAASIVSVIGQSKTSKY